ncbi:cupin [Neisseria sp. S1]|uniref:cupin n=1 Tax=Neisseria sp. S1 TaxID=3318354 RepID=UPI003A8AA1B6
MNHRIIRSAEFNGDRAWAALDIANMSGITVRLHWTDQPYKWHINDGEEVFVVMGGTVDMHYREGGQEHIVRLQTGDIFFAGIGTEHVAHPQGEARILVVEKEGSI